MKKYLLLIFLLSSCSSFKSLFVDKEEEKQIQIFEKYSISNKVVAKLEKLISDYEPVSLFKESNEKSRINYYFTIESNFRRVKLDFDIIEIGSKMYYKLEYEISNVSNSEAVTEKFAIRNPNKLEFLKQVQNSLKEVL